MPNKTITAQVHPDAIKKTSRFFDATLLDILTELMQNSRRANATRVDIHLRNERLYFADDGDGIKDPQTLLSFGYSDWDGDKANIEDAAGMGVFSLSTRGAKFHSRHKTEKTGWGVNLTKTSFTGEENVTVKSYSGNVGTLIDFPVTEDFNEIKNCLIVLSKYYPVKVTYTYGKEVLTFNQTDFLEKADMIKTFPFGRVGIFYGKHRASKASAINFFGLTNKADFPSIRDAVYNMEISALVDIDSTCGLKFVLPARKTFQKNEAWTELLETIRQCFYEYISSLKSHQFGYDTIALARSNGYTVKDAVPLLRPFDPQPNAESIRYSNGQGETIVPGALIISDFDRCADLHHIERAHGFAGENAERLYHSNSNFKGYEWYDQLTHIDGVSYTVETTNPLNELDDNIHVIENLDSSEDVKALIEDLNAADTVIERMALNLYSDYSNSRKIVKRLETDLIITMPDFGYADDAKLFHNPNFGKGVEINEVVLFLMDCYFYENDSSDADTYDTQYADFETYASIRVREALLTANDAAIATISEIVREKMLYLTSPDKIITITISAANQEAEILQAHSRQVAVEIKDAA